MHVFLGLLVAAALGLADFFGGAAGRRVGPLRSLAGAHLTGLALLGVILLTTWRPVGSGREVWLATLAGLALVSGTGFLYRGLTLGRMTVVAPITAAVISVFTVILGLIRGERPTALVLTGAVLAIVAAVVISRSSGNEETGGDAARKIAPAGEISMALLAGCSLGVFQTLLDEIGGTAGWGPILMVRVVSGGLFGLAVLANVALRRRRKRVARLNGDNLEIDEGADKGNVSRRECSTGPRKKAFRRMALDYRNAVICGTLLLAAHIMLIEALALGMLSIVGPLSGLTPVFTVIVAWIVLKDPMGKYQWTGMIVALAGVLMVSFG